MAIFHSHIQIISRGKGKSAVAAAAYRAGETIKNEYDGIVHDYTRKGGIVYTEILLPGHAPAEYSNRTVLWNAAEKIEKSIRSQSALLINANLWILFCVCTARLCLCTTSAKSLVSTIRSRIFLKSLHIA